MYIVHVCSAYMCILTCIWYMYTNVIGKGPSYADPQSISTVRRESNSNPSWLLLWETLLGNPLSAAKGKKYHKHSFSLPTSIICVCSNLT